MAQKLLRHQQAEPPRLEQYRPDVPAGVAQALRKMLAKRPEDRFQTPGEIAVALAGTEYPVAIPVPAAIATATPAPGVVKPRAILLATGMAVLLLLGAAIVPLTLAWRTHRNEDESRNLPSGSVAIVPPSHSHPPPSLRTTLPHPTTVVLQGRENSIDAIVDPLEPEASIRTQIIHRGQDRHTVWLIRFDLDKANVPRAGRVRKATLTFFVWDPHNAAATRVLLRAVKTRWSLDATWNRASKQTPWKGNGPFSGQLDLGPAGSSIIVQPDTVNDVVDPPVPYDADVTEIVRAWVEKGEENYGLAVTPTADRTVDQGLESRFQVRRTGWAKPQYAPRLTIEMTP
jgi:hypothetical protein